MAGEPKGALTVTKTDDVMSGVTNGVMLGTQRRAIIKRQFGKLRSMWMWCARRASKLDNGAGEPTLPAVSASESHSSLSTKDILAAGYSSVVMANKPRIPAPSRNYWSLKTSHAYQ
jgi:hypothetical protein